MFSNKSFKIILTGGYTLSLILTYLLGLLKLPFLFYPVLFAGPGFWLVELIGGYTIGGGGGDTRGVDFSYSYWVIPYLDNIKLPAYLPLVLALSINIINWFIIGAIIDRIYKPKADISIGQIKD